jgi:peptide-N4-(N-acetyl-beta-glucosaminyl)asparagine amidase
VDKGILPLRVGQAHEFQSGILLIPVVDTYRTQDHANDPPTPHISLHSPPHAHHRYSKACTPPDSIPYLSDGKVNTLEMYYLAKDRRVVVFLSADAGKVDLGLFEVVVPVGNGGEWYLGVTGACGGLWQKVSIPRP